MRLVVGLGNPGKKYQKNRHNTGYMALDAVAKRNNVDLSKKKFNGLYGEFTYKGEKIILLKPLSFMNNSGEVIAKFVKYFDLKPEDVLIIYDDSYIELGKYKIKEKGSSAGHNGLKSIEKHLKTTEYKRIKIGISKDSQMLMADYVLKDFGKVELTKIKQATKQLALKFDDYLEYSFAKFMSLTK